MSATLSFDNIAAVQQQALTNSARWFPELHARSLKDQVVHQALGLAGEVGEVANIVKKLNRLAVDGLGSGELVQALHEELADVFTYLLNVAGLTDCNLVDEFLRKQEICNKRWG